MTTTTRSHRSHLLALGAAAALAITAAPSVARADNKLDEQPAVRNRLLLVAKRLEATPLFEATINADFRAFVGGGLKLEYHLGDMLSIGAIGVFSASIDTNLTDKVMATLEDESNDVTREPSKTEFAQHLNKMPVHGAAYVSLTPWYGKLAAFGRAFVNFDFYFQGGVAFAQLSSSCDEMTVCDDPEPGEGVMVPDPEDPTRMILIPDDNPNDDAPRNGGLKPGLYLGGGIHIFINDFLAIDLAVRDYAFTDNPSGADFNADLFVSDSDSRFLHHLFAGVGVSIMLPTKVKRTR